MDFLTWYGIGSYGGLACCLLAAGAIAAYALLRHRGTPRQLARAVLVCLAAGCLIFLPIWWNQNRLDIYPGPALGSGEVLLLLVWCAVAGWLVPLGTLVGYATLAAPQPLAPAPASPVAYRAGSGTVLAALDDPARMRQPLGTGTAWGRLNPLEGEFAGKPVQLTRQLTLLGREFDNDVVVDDERTSRYHAELHWDHGHVHIVDRRSMNGTLVNHQPVRGVLPLKTGDVIELGAQRYRLEILPSGPLGAGSSPHADVETAKVPSAGNDPAAMPLPMLALIGLAGPAAGLRWELREAVTTIGRDSERTVCLPHESVSRLHAQIVRQRTGFFVSDLHSSNGTLVNGQSLAEPRVLHSGDILRIGEVELCCDAVLSPSRPDLHSLPSHDDHAAPSRAPGGHDQPTISLFPRDAAPADAL